MPSAATVCSTHFDRAPAASALLTYTSDVTQRGRGRIRIVIDTSVLVAALARSSSSARRIVDAWREGRLDVVSSRATLREAELVLDSRWLGRLVSRERITALLQLLRTRSTMVEIAPLGDLALKDEGDRRLVEAAVAGNATYLVSADQELLRYRGYGSTEFVTPAEFLRLVSL